VKGDSLTYVYAEHAYPGLTAADLEKTVTVVGNATSVYFGPPGYQRVAATPWFRDGAVAVMCGAQSGPGTNLVTFYRRTGP